MSFINLSNVTTVYPSFFYKVQNLYQQPVTIGHPVMQQKDGARNEPFLDAFYYFSGVGC